MAVLDASAVLAFLFGETGASTVQNLLKTSAMSTVNVAEALSRLVDRGVTAEEAARSIDELHLDIRSFSLAQARRTAALRAATRTAGLSLGDRACLALAAELQVPAMTADRAWRSIATAAGVEVELIR